MGVKFNNPATTSGSGGGTVTNVSSANTDIGVNSGTSTPILTLNSGSGANQIVKRDGSGNFTATTVTTNANLTGDVTSVGNATTLTNAPVIAKVLTGYSSGAGIVAATDSILQAIQKLNGNDVVNAVLASYEGVQRQAITNGGFLINQRVVSGSVVLTSGQYGHDRWKAGASGCSYTFATSLNITTITISAGSLIQVVEGTNLTSGTYTLSWSGTAQGKIGAGSFSATGVTGTAVGGTNLNIEFNTGTLSKVQFNIGSVALPFQPKTFSEELFSCQWYYEKSYDYATLPGTATTGVTAIGFNAASTTPLSTISFKQRKRVQPTITLYSPLTGVTGKARDSTAAVDITATVNNLAEAQFGVIYGTTSLGNSISQHYTADSEL